MLVSELISICFTQVLYVPLWAAGCGKLAHNRLANSNVPKA